MTEYWKASPNYWCKHCATYVRDTKLERQNHEATAKHQNAIKRSLRDLHRNHEREEREKERARREIDRLNGVVAGSSNDRAGSAGRSSQGTSVESALKKQREQLVELGVSIPSDFRPEMAMPGEWTVTSSRVIEDGDKRDKLATGVRKRDEMEEDKEEQDAVRGLFKKPRKWGRDTKNLHGGEDEELDTLLSGTVKLKREAGEEDEETVKAEVKAEEGAVKEELDCSTRRPDDTIQKEEPDVKLEAEENGDSSGVATVVFKKRKPKGLRTK
ncbi:hypothetical protein QQS21_010543 [Conoideocrella luteorostrata]|uniref:U1-type domain-containing protein n=1 Tax=Conoideocrella luteorostrata TaxID=1105319 RepID=A0AAJ0CH43_9HYPO|nr:hypothetical protein QQS21_010543 [Conoideocrella luteorostrata]